MLPNAFSLLLSLLKVFSITSTKEEPKTKQEPKQQTKAKPSSVFSEADQKKLDELLDNPENTRAYKMKIYRLQKKMLDKDYTRKEAERKRRKRAQKKRTKIDKDEVNTKEERDKLNELISNSCEEVKNIILQQYQQGKENIDVDEIIKKNLKKKK